MRSLTINEITYYDTLEIDNNGKITITRRIGVDNSSNLYLLDKPIITILNENVVLSSAGNGTYYFIEEIYGLRYCANYIVQNDYSDNYATKLELNSAVTQTAEQFLIEVKRKVNEDEIISKINQSAEMVSIQANKIELEGYTTINKGFSIDENGNVSIANETVKINESGIQMSNGAKIVGGDGVYTNLQYRSDNSYSNLGYAVSQNVEQAYINIYADIPENFVIDSAHITIVHQPINWNFSMENISDLTGYARNVQVYKDTLVSNYNVDYGSEFTGDEEVPGEATTILGTNGITFNATEIEKIKTQDIKKYLTAGSLTIFRIGSTTSASNYETNISEALARTGRATAILNVFGYLKLN